MSLRNQVLSLLSDGQEWHAAELADATGFSLGGVQNTLTQLKRDGVVEMVEPRRVVTDPPAAMVVIFRWVARNPSRWREAKRMWDRLHQRRSRRRRAKMWRVL